MSQIYKVYINNKEVIFINSKIIVNKNDATLVCYKPEKNKVPKIISDFVQDEKLQRLYFICRFPKQAFKSFEEDYKIVKAAGGLVRDKENRILLIFRRGKWDLPKGKIDKNEKKKHAALREVGEETGLKSLFILRRLAVTYHIYTEKNAHILKKTYWYEMISDKSEPLLPQLEEDITDIRWFHTEKLTEVFKNTYTLIFQLLTNFK